MRPQRSPSSAGEILHETARRLRLSLTSESDAATLRADLTLLPGVTSVRINPALQCVVVQHDGRPETRGAVLERLHTGASAKPRWRHAPGPVATAEVSAWAPVWAPALLAATLPLLPQPWRRGAALALAVVATRVLSQPARLRSDAPAVLLAQRLGQHTRQPPAHGFRVWAVRDCPMHGYDWTAHNVGRRP